LPAIKPAEAPESRYLNRELSWLQFNKRVLMEALDESNPILERIRFLSIFESNLDEFYMVRVSGLIEQFESGVNEPSPDGLSPSEQLRKIAEVSLPLRQAASDILGLDLIPTLSKSGITLAKYADLNDKQRCLLREHFRTEVFPLCTPLLINPPVSVPFISNRSLNLVVALSEGRLARVKIPTVVPRLVKVSRRRHHYILLEDLIASNIHALFPGVGIEGAYLFRVLRDADVEIRELEASDLISSIEETLRLRRFGDPVLLQHGPDMPAAIHQQMSKLLSLDEQDVMIIRGTLGLESLQELAGIDRPNLRYPVHIPYLPESLATGKGIFEAVASRDILLSQPYDSFRPVEEFVASSATDPLVVGIKQTLYRVGTESPIVESLANAAEDGKQVAAIVELKARFDESNNLVWARALERAGAHVTFGFAELKTHCKLSLILRKESSGLKAYAHIGTGNYNPQTARQYSDLGLFTADPDITQDISELFNLLTGFGRQTEFRKILVAPLNLREGILHRIRRETQHAKKGKKAHIIFKLNALVDPEVIEQLYSAAQAGVKIELIVRGTCCLKPGVPGLSDNVQVVSIIGRFLEHGRIYYFENAGKPDVLIGSADAMRRNLDRRIEVLSPVESPLLIQAIRENLLEVELKDNLNSWILRADGAYEIRTRSKGEKALDSQAWQSANPLSKLLYGSDASKLG
jgi:polyphosphate kinase